MNKVKHTGRLILTIAATIMITLCLFGLSGCTSDETTTMFTKLCEHTDGLCETYFYEDEDTENIYIYLRNYQRGALSPYYNDKGEVMKIDEFTKVHTKKYHKE